MFFGGGARGEGSRRRAPGDHNQEFGSEGPGGTRKRLTFPDRIRAKGAIAMIYGEPETPRFLAAVLRLKQLQRRKERQTRQAKQRVRLALRKMREC